MRDSRNLAETLIASADDALCAALRFTVRQCGRSAMIVRSAADALAVLNVQRPRLSFLDQALTDLTGLDVARAVGADPARVFVLIGADLTTAITVAAMRLGAFTVLEKPVGKAEIAEVVQSVFREPAALATRSVARPPRSVAERWAQKVLRGCEADGDLRTLGAWAAAAGLSYSSLCEVCRLAGVQPLAARDLTRVLRAVVQSRAQGCRIGELLDVCDSRTMNALMSRAAVDPRRRGEDVSVDGFLASQHFVPANNAGLAVLRELLPLASTPHH